MIVPELLEKEVVLLDIGAVGNPPSPLVTFERRYSSHWI